MALSSVTYTGNGSTTSFAIPFPYLFQSDVSATVNGVTTTFTWTNPALVHFAVAPITGAAVFIVRKTNITTLDVVFTDGSTVQASDINTAELQSLYLAQESNDGVSVAIAAAATATAATGAANAAAAAANAAVASLVPFTGDTGAGGVQGLVPVPPAGSAAAGKLLGAGGSWVTPPASSPSSILYTAPFTGAVSQTLLNRLGRMMFIEDFGGGIGAAGSVNTAALNAALACLGSNSGAIVFGAGTYNFSALSTFSYPSSTTAQGVSLLGMGAGVTCLRWASTAGLVFNMSSCFHIFHARDISFLSGTVPSANLTCLTIHNSVQGGAVGSNDITRCTFSGDDHGALTNAWGTAVALVGTACFTIDTVIFYGTSTNAGNGLTFNGVPTGGFKWAIMLTIMNTQFMNLGVGLTLGVQWQGVTVSNCNFTNGAAGILQQSGDVSNGLSELLVTNCQFGVTAQGILLQSPVFDVTVMGSLFIIATTQNGFQATPGNWSGGCLMGNSFIASSVSGTEDGIVIASIATVGTPGPTTITGNTFFNLQVGVNLLTGSSGINVQSNAYKGCTITATNAAGSANTVGGGSA